MPPNFKFSEGCNPRLAFGIWHYNGCWEQSLCTFVIIIEVCVGSTSFFNFWHWPIFSHTLDTFIILSLSWACNIMFRVYDLISLQVAHYGHTEADTTTCSSQRTFNNHEYLEREAKKIHTLFWGIWTYRTLWIISPRYSRGHMIIV